MREWSKKVTANQTVGDYRRRQARGYKRTQGKKEAPSSGVYVGNKKRIRLVIIEKKERRRSAVLQTAGGEKRPWIAERRESRPPEECTERDKKRGDSEELISLMRVLNARDLLPGQQPCSNARRLDKKRHLGRESRN